MSDRFEQTARSFFRTLMGLFPQRATLCGVHEYDDDLPDAGAGALAEVWKRIDAAAGPLLALSPEDLTPEERLDRDLVRHIVEYTRFWYETAGLWRREADALSEIGMALCVQLWRDYAPVDERMEQIATRLERLPEYLESFRTQVTDPKDVWTDLAIATTLEFPAFVQTLAGAVDGQVTPAVKARLDAAADAAAVAAEAHYQWLVNEIRPRSKADWPLGPELFGELLRVRELDASLDAILGLGEEQLARGREEIARLANEVKPGRPPDEALAVVLADRPLNFESALKEYKTAVRRSRRFLRERGLISHVPGSDSIAVVETPTFLRRLMPVAAYLGPGQFETEQVGYYFVTPPDDPAGLVELHNAATIVNTTTHEAYPGHHVQTLCANRTTSLIRRLPYLVGSGAEYVEGWGLYCEHLMVEEGFQATSQRKLMQMRDHCLRAVRVTIDIGLQTGRLTLPDAVALLRDAAGMPPSTAHAEAQVYAHQPGYFLSYMVGAAQIMELREVLRQRMGEHFSLRWFHDALLGVGEIPLRYARRAVEAAAEAAMQEAA